jgi:hypothetical protein
VGRAQSREGFTLLAFFASFLLCEKKKDSRKAAETQRFQLTRLLLAFVSKKSTHAKPAYHKQASLLCARIFFIRWRSLFSFLAVWSSIGNSVFYFGQFL